MGARPWAGRGGAARTEVGGEKLSPQEREWLWSRASAGRTGKGPERTSETQPGL